MNIRHLQNFITIAEYGSFSRASSIIGVAQPSLGRQIQQLEQICGTKLFYRHGRGVSLTPEGQTFLARVQPLMDQLATVTHDLATPEQRLKGTVTIGMTSTVTLLLGLALLNKVKAVAPEIKLNFVSGYSGYIHEWLVDDRLDIAILHDARRSQHISVDFLARARLFLISSPHQAVQLGLHNASSVPFCLLKKIPLILPSANHGLRRTLEATATQHNIQLTVDHELDTLSLLKKMTGESTYCTVLAMPAVAQEVKLGQLIAIPIEKPEIETRLMVATSLNKPLTEAKRCVLDQIQPALHQAMTEHPENAYITTCEPASDQKTE